ncbi:hypothetical protein ACHAWF_005441 [Thalassiosira exigua]
METDIPTGSDAGHDEEALARQNSRAAGGPMTQQYCLWAIVFVLAVIALGLGGAGLSMGNEALDLAKSNSKAILLNTQTVVDVEKLANFGPPTTSWQQPPAPAVPSPPAPGLPVPVPAPAVTPPPVEPTAPPGPDYSQEVGTRNPRWFHTGHDAYESIAGSQYNQEHHSFTLAGLFCHTQDMAMCSYDDICPRGQSRPPFRGGPPGIEDDGKQWAPFITEGVSNASSQAGGTWVMVGTIPEDDGGTVENMLGNCWTWSEWMNGLGMDIEDSYPEENRRWVLCCEREVDGDRRE